MADTFPIPQPIYDTLDALEANEAPIPAYVDQSDYAITKEFLLAYQSSPDTFHSYRREVDRFLQWVFLIAEKKVTTIGREDMEAFIKFCQNPPSDWIALKMVARFTKKDGVKIINPDWRPFVAKSEKHQSRKPSVKRYKMSDQGVKAVLKVLSTYYSFLETEDYAHSNPVKRIRQKSRFVRKVATTEPIRRLSELQWDYVIETAEIMADNNHLHERTFFIMSSLYGLYLRISELADTTRWTPMMKHFFQDDDGHWWFKTVGKGNKERDISVSKDMVQALKRYRKSLGLSSLPSPADSDPLIPKQKGIGGIGSTRQLRDIVQKCFNEAIFRLQQDGFEDDANKLQSATVHWLRHTGISDDVRRRPKEHVRDDAGHSSSATTDRYIDIEKRERHASANKKKLRPIS